MSFMLELIIYFKAFVVFMSGAMKELVCACLVAAGDFYFESKIPIAYPLGMP